MRELYARNSTVQPITAPMNKIKMGGQTTRGTKTT